MYFDIYCGSCEIISETHKRLLKVQVFEKEKMYPLAFLLFVLASMTNVREVFKGTKGILTSIVQAKISLF